MLIELIDYYSNGNQSDFGRIIGVKPQTISSWISRNTLDQDLIYSKCVNLNPHWLLTGEGDMIKQDSPQIQQLHHPKTADPIHEEQLINLYDFEASAGLRVLFDNNTANVLDTIRIPNLPRCDGAIHISGDSMYPVLKSGDIILYKEISLDIRNIYWGEMYLLSYYEDETEVAVVVKYVQRSEEAGMIRLASQNPHHAPRDIEFARVNAMALVKASIRINSMY